MKIKTVGLLLVSTAIIISLSWYAVSGFRESKKDNGIHYAGLEVVEVMSDMDGSRQPAIFYAPETEEPIPLIVSLHVWNGDHRKKDKIAKYAIEGGVAYIYPHLRGHMNNPDSCCSDLVISDIENAIDYAVANSNVDLDRIYVTGVSGGAYTTLCAYMKLNKHAIRGFLAWTPLSDLEEWYRQNKIRKQDQYVSDIEACTGSEKGRLNVEEARKRSPINWQTPTDRFAQSFLDIYAGAYDGLQQNGSIPITQAIRFYNKIASEHSAPEENLVSREDMLRLFEEERPVGEYGTIEKREIFYRNSFENVRLTIFEGGHEKEDEFVFKELISR